MRFKSGKRGNMPTNDRGHSCHRAIANDRSDFDWQTTLLPSSMKEIIQYVLNNQIGMQKNKKEAYYSFIPMELGGVCTAAKTTPIQGWA